MTVAVFAGCRYLNVGEWWWPTLDGLADREGITWVWHGACHEYSKPFALRGADLGIDTWARNRGPCTGRRG
jgi:hypothetical protein